MENEKRQRIAYLDGIRGLAISLVVAFHYWGPTYANRLPFGNRFHANPVIANGWVGVELFFLLSGYVIFTTIERCDSVGEFLGRRFIRLFPAMVVATVMIFTFRLLIHPGTTGQQPKFLDILPGLTFISPSFYHAILKLDLFSIDGVFWTLYVEIAFYFSFSALYFALGWRKAVVGLISAALIVTAFRWSVNNHYITGVLSRSTEPLEWAGVEYFLWFASGILFAKSSEHSDRSVFFAAVAVGLTAVAFQPSYSGLLGNTDRLALLLALAFFTMAQRLSGLQRMLSSPALTFAGLISYPLYLLHNNLGFSFTLLTAQGTALPLGLTPIPGLIDCCLLAWGISSAEPWARSLFNRVKPARSSFT